MATAPLQLLRGLSQAMHFVESGQLYEAERVCLASSVVLSSLLSTADNSCQLAPVLDAWLQCCYMLVRYHNACSHPRMTTCCRCRQPIITADLAGCAAQSQQAAPSCGSHPASSGLALEADTCCVGCSLQHHPGATAQTGSISRCQPSGHR
jgi:hypothetical protein